MLKLTDTSTATYLFVGFIDQTAWRPTRFCSVNMEENGPGEQNGRSGEKQFGKSYKGVKEPIRKTMYDVLVENLELVGRKTFIHRIIYCGLHYFSNSSEKKLEDFFQKIVEEVNTKCLIIEKLSGFLFYHDKYFVHLLEGDEDAIGQHLKLLYRSQDFGKFGKLKLLVSLHHINNRLINDWKFYNAEPRKSSSNFNANSVTDIAKITFDCVKKFSDLSVAFVETTSNTEREIEVEIIDKIDPLLPLLPEIEQLELLINGEFPMDLDEYRKSYGTLFSYQLHTDKIWPLPEDLVPYDVFETAPQTAIKFPNFQKTQTEPEDNDDDDLLPSLI
ncbi:unnamed protein product [Phyllotreta striolata]|uniref:Uncharacterized protein n=1 Tax=Phyllotreta striolata TaxID=444603 RepID=A0A9N9TTG3_PHYSR|nr:unnamed protein product [Phyllotreta striolata]